MGVSHGAITLLLRDSVEVSILLITKSLESVETGLSHLKIRLCWPVAPLARGLE